MKRDIHKKQACIAILFTGTMLSVYIKAFLCAFPAVHIHSPETPVHQHTAHHETYDHSVPHSHDHDPAGQHHHEDNKDNCCIENVTSFFASLSHSQKSTVKPDTCPAILQTLTLLPAVTFVDVSSYATFNSGKSPPPNVSLRILIQSFLI